jgi:hypothetical protein
MSPIMAFAKQIYLASAESHYVSPKLGVHGRENDYMIESLLKELWAGFEFAIRCIIYCLLKIMFSRMSNTLIS